MRTDPFFDLHPDHAAWGHAVTPDRDGLPLHYVRQGEGKSDVAVLLLHGWPGFWYDWRRVLPRVAQFASVIAVDLRGFGSSAKPDWPPDSAYSPEANASNVLTLLDHLQIEKALLVGYDIGSRVAQTVAQQAPERVQALVLSAPVYPGIGTRLQGPEVQRECWYQYFHTIAQADQLIGHDLETVRLYLSYFYDHWIGNKEALRPKEFDAIVQVYAQPGAVRGSIAWYRRASFGQLAKSPPAPIAHPTVVLWGEADPVLLAAWADQLQAYFSQLLRVQILPGIGHFVPFEAPDQIIEAIRSLW